MAGAGSASLLRRPVVAHGSERHQVPVSVRHRDGDSLADTLEKLGVAPGGPVVVVVGGAAGSLSEVDEDARRRLVELALVPVVRDEGAIVITGGTDVGVMREMGRALAEHSPNTVVRW